MPGWSELTPFMLLGLVGAAHCAGMCGGFAVAVGLAAGPARRTVLGHQLTYVLGKALTYGVLGLLAARAGALLSRGGAGLVAAAGGERTPALELLQSALAWIAGLVLILFGLAALLPGRGRAFLPRVPGWARLAGASQRLFAGVRGLPGGAGALGTGLVTGLLPCGLSWGAVALATTVEPATGALGMFLFGLATGPVLLLVGLGWRGLSTRFRTVAARAAGPLLIVFGAFTVLRGGLPGPLAAAEEALPDCCQEEAGAG